MQSNSLAIETYRLLMPQLKKKALRGYERCLFHGPNYFLPPLTALQWQRFMIFLLLNGSTVSILKGIVIPRKKWWKHCRGRMVSSRSRTIFVKRFMNISIIQLRKSTRFIWQARLIFTLVPGRTRIWSFKKIDLSYKAFTLFVGTIWAEEEYSFPYSCL